MKKKSDEQKSDTKQLTKQSIIIWRMRYPTNAPRQPGDVVQAHQRVFNQLERGRQRVPVKRRRGVGRGGSHITAAAATITTASATARPGHSSSGGKPARGEKVNQFRCHAIGH